MHVNDIIRCALFSQKSSKGRKLFGKLGSSKDESETDVKKKGMSCALLVWHVAGIGKGRQCT